MSLAVTWPFDSDRHKFTVKSSLAEHGTTRMGSSPSTSGELMGRNYVSAITSRYTHVTIAKASEIVQGVGESLLLVSLCAYRSISKG